MEGNTPGARLLHLRDGAKMTQDELAEKLGVSRTQISKYQTGAGIPDYVVERAAQTFGVTAAFIKYGDTDSRMARVVGYVGAGGRVEAIEHPPFRYVEVPASWTDAVALEVRGDSCWPIYEDRDTIVVRGERRMLEEEFLGKMCAIETADGLGMVKRVRRGTSAGLYTLESPNAPTIEDVPLQSARPVKMLVR